MSTISVKYLTKNLVNKGQEKLSLEYSFDLSVQNIDVGSEIINSNKGQVYAKGLYESVGFKAISDVYDEVHIPHVKMKIEL